MVVRSKNESRMQMSMVMKARMQMRIWMSAIEDVNEDEMKMYMMIWMKAIEDVNEDETLLVRSRATFTPSPATGCTPASTIRR